MGNEERKEDAGKSAGEAKVGEVVGAEAEPLVGSRLLAKSVFDEVKKRAGEFAKSLVDNAAKGHAGCAKMVGEYCDAYEQQLVGGEPAVSLAVILLKALEEESDSDESAGSGE